MKSQAASRARNCNPNASEPKPGFEPKPASLGLPAVSPGHDSASGSGLTSPLLGNANGRATKKDSTIEGKYWVPADEAERRAASESGRGRIAASAVPDVQAQGRHPAPIQVNVSLQLKTKVFSLI
jgi:hypothetical protein